MISEKDFGNVVKAEGENKVQWFLFVERKNIKELEKMLEAGKVSIDSIDDVQDTALHKAVRMENQELVRVLLRKGANFDLRNKEGKTAKELALQLKLSNIVKIFAPFQRAERKISSQQIQALQPKEKELTLEEKVQLKHYDEKNINLPIFIYCIKEMQSGTLQDFIIISSKINDINKVVDQHNSTLLHWAAFFQRIDIIRYLIFKRNANYQQSNNHEEFFLDILLKNKNHKITEEGMGIFIELIEKNSDETDFKLLISFFATAIMLEDKFALEKLVKPWILKMKDKEQFLRHMVVTAVINEKKASLKYLVDIFERIPTSFNLLGHVPLVAAMHLAKRNHFKDLETIEILMQNGADPNMREGINGDEKSARELASKFPKKVMDLLEPQPKSSKQPKKQPVAPVPHINKVELVKSLFSKTGWTVSNIHSESSANNIFILNLIGNHRSFNLLDEAFLKEFFDYRKNDFDFSLNEHGIKLTIKLNFSESQFEEINTDLIRFLEHKRELYKLQKKIGKNIKKSYSINEEESEVKENKENRENIRNEGVDEQELNQKIYEANLLQRRSKMVDKLNGESSHSFGKKKKKKKTKKEKIEITQSITNSSLKQPSVFGEKPCFFQVKPNEAEKRSNLENKMEATMKAIQAASLDEVLVYNRNGEAVDTEELFDPAEIREFEKMFEKLMN